MTTKCDIFSFGVILWELVTGTRPWEELNEFQARSRMGISPRANQSEKVTHSRYVYPPFNSFIQIIYHVAMIHERLPLSSEEVGPTKCPAALRDLILSCWDDQDKRPSAAMVQEKLQELYICS